MPRLPAEWETQDAVMLTWPHANTDWQSVLPQAHANYCEILEQLLKFVSVLVVAPHEVLEQLDPDLRRIQQGKPFSLHVFTAPSNDTWARDHGAITVKEGETSIPLDFTFNGWGNKFAAELDNQINTRLQQFGLFKRDMQQHDFVLEGGAIESDGQGCILTTSQCLLNPNRNPSLSRSDIEDRLKQLLGAKKILWLEHGYLAGDDTDSHIDTLARFAPDNVITYVKCDDEKDEHFSELLAMEEELKLQRNVQGELFTLLPLPWPQAKFDEDGERLPASYANYLITNDAVLVPTYQDPSDELALAQIGKAYPNRLVIGIDCLTLILQHGSLHCITMQFPQGSLSLKDTAA